MPSLNLYIDAGLSTLADTPLILVQDVGGVGHAQRVLYLGSNDAGHTFYAQSSPTSAPITLSVADSLPASGQPSTSIKLALSEAGLASAVGGAPLNVALSINAGAAGAIPIWIRFADATTVTGISTDLILTCNNLAYTT
jgi:hypothetical protein